MSNLDRPLRLPWYGTEEDTDTVAAAAGISPYTTEFDLRDAYGYTYDGTRTVKVLAALARSDITPTLSDRVHTVAFALLAALQDKDMPQTVIDRLDRTPYEMVALVTYLCRIAESEYSWFIVDWIICFAEHLASLPAIPYAERDFPPHMVESRRDRLYPDRPTFPLLRHHSHHNAADQRWPVTLRVKITHSETIRWTTVRDLDVPAEEANYLLADPAALAKFVERHGWKDTHERYDAAEILETDLDDVIHVGPTAPLTYPAVAGQDTSS